MVGEIIRSSLLLLHCFAATALAATTTTISVTSTTTVHVTATDYRGACENFVGACVVYGTYGGAPYTTTVYSYRPQTTASSTSTVTNTVLTTTIVSDGAACSGFSGACVVYGGSQTASTTYYPQSSHTGVGNGQGYIGPNSNGGDGFVGAMGQIQRLWVAITMLTLVALLLVC